MSQLEGPEAASLYQDNLQGLRKGTQFEERGKGFPYIVIHYIVGLGEWRREKKKKEEEKGPEKKQREAGGAESKKREKDIRKKQKARPRSPHRQRLEGIIEEVGPEQLLTGRGRG